MQPTNPVVSSRVWRDITVTGDLVVLPENAAPGTMVGSAIGVTVMLFWLARRMSPDINAE